MELLSDDFLKELCSAWVCVRQVARFQTTNKAMHVSLTNFWRNQNKSFLKNFNEPALSKAAIQWMLNRSIYLDAARLYFGSDDMDMNFLISEAAKLNLFCAEQVVFSR